MQEAQRSVECGAAPHLHAEKIWQTLRDGAGGGQQVMRADARGHQRLVGVAEGGVSDQQAVFFAGPGGEFFRAELLQELARTWRRLDAGNFWQGGGFERRQHGLPFYFRIAVQDHVSEIGKNFCGTVAAARKFEQFGIVFEERGGDFTGAKLRVVHYILYEGDVRLYAADAKFAQRAVHALAGFGKVGTPGGHFDEERIVVGRELGTGVGGAAVETDAESGGRTIGGELAVVRREILVGVFGGYAALQCGAVERDVRLLRQRQRGLVQLITLRDKNLRTHQVDAGDHFGDGVFYLDAGIHFDEIPLAGIHVVEKFDGAGVAIVGFARQLQRGVAQFFANARRQIRGGGDLHYFLMAALHGAVAFVQMQEMAVMVAEDLHFDVTRVGQIFFQEHAGVAERGAGFSLRFFEQGVELRSVVHDAHAAPAAAHRGFDDYRIADLFRDFLRFGGKGDGIVGSRKDAHAAEAASLRAAVLSPSKSSRSGVGPMKMIPALSQARANSAFSARKP